MFDSSNRVPQATSGLREGFRVEHLKLVVPMLSLKVKKGSGFKGPMLMNSKPLQLPPLTVEFIQGAVILREVPKR